MNAVRSRMTHRCLIERNTPSETNDYGHAGPPEWATYIEDQPCFYYFGRKGSETVSVERTAVIEGPCLLLPLGVDVDEEDRVNGITDRQGNVIAGGIHNIRPVTRHHTHLEMQLEKVG